MANDAIHPDYKDLRIGDASFDGGFMLLINTLIRLQNLFRNKNPAVSYQKYYAKAQDASNIKIEVIRPVGQKPSRCLVHYSGGAFCVGPQPAHYEKAELYAIEANCTVIFVTYRLAPKHRFPIGLNDCFSALQWTIDNAEMLGIDAKNIIVAGDSAGGFMAAAIPQMAMDKLTIPLKAQLMIYPVTDPSCSSTSATEFSAVPIFSGNANRAMWDAYLGDLDRNALPAYAAPIERQQLQGLPNAYIETAEFDPLRDEGIAYAQRLENAGVNVQLNNTKATVHGFDIYTKNDLYYAAMKSRYDFLNAEFAR